MKPTVYHQDIEQLLADADEPIARIHSDAVHDLQEEQRIPFEKQVQALRRRKAGARAHLAKAEKAGSGTFGEGMHEAIDAIVKAIEKLGGFLS